jgi:hypothetical protein
MRTLISPNLFNDPYNRKIAYSSTIWHTRRNGPTILKRRKGDTMSRVHGNFTALCRKGKRRYITPTCSRWEFSGQVLECSGAPSCPKLQNTHMSYVDKSERMLKAMVYTAEFQVNETCLFFY